MEGGEKMKNKNVLIVILAVVIGGGAFFAGMKYQQNRIGQTFGRFGNQQGDHMGQFQQGVQGFRPVNGEIISADDKSITVKLADGSSKIVLLTDTAVINKSEPASKTDLTVGEKVAAFGTENSDGSVTGQNIQLNPVLRDNFRNSR